MKQMKKVDYAKPIEGFVYKKKYVYQFVKRFFDILASFLMLLLLLLPFIIIAIVIKCDSKGPVFFKQERITKNGKHFKMIKFRSMVQDAEGQLEALRYRNEASGPMFKIKDDPRITKVGRFIRKTSIDELPQLLNILGGSMSFVGPRPPLPAEVAEYNENDMNRLLVKQGLTCIWQVSGRSNVPFEQQVEMDKDYVMRRSLWLDLVLLFKTVGAVFKSDGAM